MILVGGLSPLDVKTHLKRQQSLSTSTGGEIDKKE